MSSGDLAADRRFSYAKGLMAEGDAGAAADVMAQALALVPTWAEGQFTLGEMLAAANQREAAVAAFGAYLALDPADSMGAAVKLALLGVKAPDALPEAYVRRLFDTYAPRFDTALVEKLNYRAPALLRAAVEEAAPGRRFARLLDLGCGTGLSGAAFRDLADWMAGVDLSEAMVRKAQEKNIYDQLAVGEMLAMLEADTSAYDLVIAADVLVYVGDLTPVFAAVKRRLAAEGLFAFTVQKAASGRALGADHRFSHSQAYVEQTAAAAGFTVALMDDVVSRQDAGKDVPGLLTVLR